MRALLVIAEMGSGGAEAVVAELALGLGRRDVEVVVASAGGRRAVLLEQAGVRIAHVPLAERSPRGVLRAQQALRRAGRSQRPDVVHAHNVGATLTAHIGLRRLRRRPPLVTTFHGVAEEDYARAVRVLDRCSDHVVAVHEDLADRLRAAGLRRPPLSVIRNAIGAVQPVHRDAARATLGLSRDVPVALCAARLVPQKRHDVLVDAWSRLPGAPVLLLAGDGELREDLTADVRRRGLDHRVLVLGDRPDVPTLLAAADVFVLSSDWEGLPIALLEAMAAGVPVVATDVDGVREALGTEAARLVPRREPEQLAQALEEVLAGRALREQMSDAARRRTAARGSVEGMVDAYVDIYLSSATGRPPRPTVSP